MKDILTTFIEFKKTLERPPADLGQVESLSLQEFNPSARSVVAALLTIAVCIRESRAP